MVCYNARDRMGLLKLEDGKESEDHLSHCLANVVNGFPGKVGTSFFNLIIFLLLVGQHYLIALFYSVLLWNHCF